MVRAAAKNYQKATVVTDPHDYSLVCEELAANSGSISLATRFMLAKKLSRIQLLMTAPSVTI